MSSRERQARLRARRRDQREWKPDNPAFPDGPGRWVAPFWHLGSEKVYNAWRCQCDPCLDAHAWHNRVERVAGDITAPLTLGALTATSLGRVVAVPPPLPSTPPPALLPPPGARHAHGQGRHRARC